MGENLCIVLFGIFANKYQKTRKWHRIFEQMDKNFFKVSLKRFIMIPFSTFFVKFKEYIENNWQICCCKKIINKFEEKFLPVVSYIQKILENLGSMEEVVLFESMNCGENASQFLSPDLVLNIDNSRIKIIIIILF